MPGLLEIHFNLDGFVPGWEELILPSGHVYDFQSLLKNMKVFSTIIDGKERYVVEGIITREK